MEAVVEVCITAGDAGTFDSEKGGWDWYLYTNCNARLDHRVE
jgi:hypothetical protein